MTTYIEDNYNIYNNNHQTLSTIKQFNSQLMKNRKEVDYSKHNIDNFPVTIDKIIVRDEALVNDALITLSRIKFVFLEDLTHVKSLNYVEARSLISGKYKNLVDMLVVSISNAKMAGRDSKIDYHFYQIQFDIIKRNNSIQYIFNKIEQLIYYLNQPIKNVKYHVSAIYYGGLI